MGSAHERNYRSEPRVSWQAVDWEIKKMPLTAAGAPYRRRVRGEGTATSLNNPA